MRHLIAALLCGALVACGSVTWTGTTAPEVRAMIDQTVPELEAMGLDLPEPGAIEWRIAEHGELPMPETDHMGRVTEAAAVVVLCQEIVFRPGWIDRSTVAAELIKIARCRAGEPPRDVTIGDPTWREWVRRYG